MCFHSSIVCPLIEKYKVSGDISSGNPFTWCAIPFVEATKIDLTETVDFIPFFKLQHSTWFKMESPSIRVFYLAVFMDFEFFKGYLCGVVLLSLNIIFSCYLLLLASYHPAFVNLRVWIYYLLLNQ